MDARVKASYRWNTLSLFSGVEFVKNEFRPIPSGYEDAALAEERLEVRDTAVKQPDIVEKIEEAVESAYRPRRQYRRKAEEE